MIFESPIGDGVFGLHALTRFRGNRTYPGSTSASGAPGNSPINFAKSLDPASRPDNITSDYVDTLVLLSE
jgi:hypothetical protein